MTKIRKVLFPVAGFGTRFLPATKAMPKELLPIVDKPLIQYAAEEAIAAGIDTLIFVTGRNKRAIKDHFDNNQELEMALRAKGKNGKADMVRNILPEGVECIFDSLRNQPAGAGGEIQLADAINIHAQQGLVETVRLNGRRLDCRSVDIFIRVSNLEYEKR